MYYYNISKPKAHIIGDIMTIFSDMGSTLAMEHINASEIGDLPLDNYKTVSFKCPDYLVEALDAFSTKASTTRTDIIVSTLQEYLVHAISEFVQSYNSQFVIEGTSEQQILSAVSDMAKDLSTNASHFLITRTMNHLELS